MNVYFAFRNLVRRGYAEIALPFRATRWGEIRGFIAATYEMPETELLVKCHHDKFADFLVDDSPVCPNTLFIGFRVPPGAVPAA